MELLSVADAYEAPRVELVLEAAEIEREVHYAGSITCPDCFPT